MRINSLKVLGSSIFMVACAPSSAHAQQDGLRIIHLFAELPVSPEQEKLGAEQLALLESDSRFSIQLDRQHLKTGWHSHVDPASVRSALALVGIVATVSGTDPSPAGGTKNAPSDPNALPVFVDTGNPEVDNSNFQSAKAAWISTHPTEYQRLLGETP